MHIQKWVANGPNGLADFELVEADLPDPGPGEVTIEVRAAGMNPVDFKSPGNITDPTKFPVPLGFEVAGVIAAVGPDAETANGPVALGDPVIAFRIRGGYATALNVDASDVFPKPDRLDDPAAANLLLAGVTADEMLHVAAVGPGDTVLVHAGSGAVGLCALQLAAALGATAVATASERNHDLVRRFGGIPVVYGDGLLERVRAVAPDGIDAALDLAGTDEAADVSLELVANRSRLVTAKGGSRAARTGFTAVTTRRPESAEYRRSRRAHLVDLAAQGQLLVHVAQTFAFADAITALELLQTGHPGGKLALVP